jgi:hypothetical protein
MVTMEVRIRPDEVAPRLLDLAYDPAIPPALLARMERIGRRLGLPMATLELLGQDATVCEAFVRATADGGDRLAHLLDFALLHAALERRDHAAVAQALAAQAAVPPSPFGR